MLRQITQEKGKGVEITQQLEGGVFFVEGSLEHSFIGHHPGYSHEETSVAGSVFFVGGETTTTEDSEIKENFIGIDIGGKWAIFIGIEGNVRIGFTNKRIGQQ